MRQVDNRIRDNIQRRTDRRSLMLKTDDKKVASPETTSVEEKKETEITGPLHDQPVIESKINNSPGIIQKQSDDEESGDDEGSGTGDKKKFKFKNLAKNITRGIGKGVRSIGGDKRNLIPHGNIQTRQCVITMEYDAPKPAPELVDKANSEDKTDEETGATTPDKEKKSKRKGATLYKKDTSFNGASVARYAEKGAGSEDKGRIDWTYTGNFRPDLGESIESFKSADFHFDGIADQDSFTLAKNVDGEKETNEEDMAGDMKMGRSHYGYTVHVESRVGLTKLPRNSDWKYDIDLEMKVHVPYTEDIDGNPYPRDEDDEVPPDNKRPWWHKWWYGNKVPLKE